MTWLLFILAGCVLIYTYLNRYYGFSLSLHSWKGGERRPKRRSSALPVDAESQYLLCTFSIAAKVISADGEVSEDERSRLSEFMKEELELTEKEEQLAWQVFDNALQDELEIQDYAKAFRRYFPDRVQLTDRVIVTLLGLAASDGYVHEKEERAIRSVALLLDISEPAFERLKQEHLSTEAQYH